MNTTKAIVKATGNKATVVIGKHEHKILVKLADNYNMNMGQYLESSIHYFRKTGINPSDESYSPAEQIKNLEKRIDDVIKIIRAL
jgi:hypothetical protein